MPPRLTFGERISQLERTFQAKGMTQKDLAESLGVSPRTVRRWKSSKVAAPRATKSNPNLGKDVKQTLTSRFGGLDYEKLRRRERYHFREAPPEIQPKGPRPPKGTFPVSFGNVELGLLDGTIAVARSTEILDRNPRLREALQGGETVELTLTYQPFGATDPDDILTIFHRVEGKRLDAVSISSDLWAVTRPIIEREGSSAIISVSAAHVVG